MLSDKPIPTKLIRQTIHQFIAGRLAEKLEPQEKALAKHLAGSDEYGKVSDKIAALKEQYQPATWLESAAKRSAQIKLVTHAIKMTHPEAKGSSIYYPTDRLASDQWLSTASLGAQRAEDVVGNAAALDIYKLLKSECEQQRLLDLALAQHPNFVQALSDSPETAKQLASQFAALAQLDSNISSHAQAKQLYWPIQQDQYHLLAPLSSSSLSHAIFERINHQRFSEEAKQAREARKAMREHHLPVVEFPSLALQKMGGTKPQNISQLNSERGGTNYLLPSLPPQWQAQSIQAPKQASTIFAGTLARAYRQMATSGEQASNSVTTLARYLKALPENVNNVDIRDRRQALTAAVVDDLLAYAAAIQSLPAGWSTSSQLMDAEKFWLDPARAKTDPEFATARDESNWQQEIIHRFSNWLNAELLRKKIPVTAIEYTHWQRCLKGELKILKDNLNYDD